MNQLEYRYAYSGAQVLAYSIQTTPNQQFILYSGSNGINSSALPSGVWDCSSMKLDQSFLDAVNKNLKQVYMVHQTQTGYLMMPLIAALQVERNGSYFFFRGPNYQFAFDTTNLVYQANLSSAGSPNTVYFTGLQIKDCLYQYAFRSEPVQAGREKADFDFVPGIGMTNERTGMTPADLESNQTRLWFVNGMSLDDYVATKCGTRGAPKVLPPDMIDYTRPDKESAPAGASPQIPATQGAVRCQESSGKGYHIVQPKETLMSISRQYKVPLAALVKWNNITEPNKIEICQKVYVVDPATLKVRPLSAAVGGGAFPTPPPPAATSQQAPAPSIKAQVPAPNFKSPEMQQGATAPAFHIVKPGESVSSIARQYQYTESQFRQINGFPQAGPITIYPGQKLLVSEYGLASPQAPLMSTYTPPPAVSPRAPAPSTAPQSPHFNASVPPPPTGAGGVATGIPPNPAYNTNTSPPQQGTYVPPVTSNPSFTTPPVTGTQVIPAEPQQSTRVTYYQEYVVQQGDTMNAIAVKFKTSAQELALLNNKDVNEVLIAGQRMLVPK